MTRILTPKDLRHGRPPVDHRDGGGHLDPLYEADLRARVHAVRRIVEGAFVRASQSADPDAERSAEDFVLEVTSGGSPTTLRTGG